MARNLLQPHRAPHRHQQPQIAGLRKVIEQVGGNHRPQAVADDDQFTVVGNRVEHPALDRVAAATARAISAGIREQQRNPTLGDLICGKVRDRARAESGAVTERSLKLAARQPIVARRAPVLIVRRPCISGRRRFVGRLGLDGQQIHVLRGDRGPSTALEIAKPFEPKGSIKLLSPRDRVGVGSDPMDAQHDASHVRRMVFAGRRPRGSRQRHGKAPQAVKVLLGPTHVVGASLSVTAPVSPPVTGR